MNYVVGVIIVWIIGFPLLIGSCFFMLLINELVVMAFGVDPLEWLKRNVFEPVGRGLLEVLHKEN